MKKRLSIAKKKKLNLNSLLKKSKLMTSLNNSLGYLMSWWGNMKDSLRESLSYFGIFRKMLGVKKKIEPTRVNYGPDKDQYFLYHAPQTVRLTMKMEEKRL